jgi:hypothetical protein
MRRMQLLQCSGSHFNGGYCCRCCRARWGVEELRAVVGVGAARGGVLASVKGVGVGLTAARLLVQTKQQEQEGQQRRRVGRVQGRRASFTCCARQACRWGA